MTSFEGADPDLRFALEAEQARVESYRAEILRLEADLELARQRSARLDAITSSETWRIGIAVGRLLRPVVTVARRVRGRRRRRSRTAATKADQSPAHTRRIDICVLHDGDSVSAQAAFACVARQTVTTWEFVAARGVDVGRDAAASVGVRSVAMLGKPSAWVEEYLSCTARTPFVISSSSPYLADPTFLERALFRLLSEVDATSARHRNPKQEAAHATLLSTGALVRSCALRSGEWGRVAWMDSALPSAHKANHQFDRRLATTTWVYPTATRPLVLVMSTPVAIANEIIEWCLACGTTAIVVSLGMLGDGGQELRRLTPYVYELPAILAREGWPAMLSSFFQRYFDTVMVGLCDPSHPTWIAASSQGPSIGVAHDLQWSLGLVSRTTGVSTVVPVSHEIAHWLEQHRVGGVCAPIDLTTLNSSTQDARLWAAVVKQSVGIYARAKQLSDAQRVLAAGC